MKAAVMEAAGKLTIKELPKPEMGEYGALCELLYGAVCAGTDQHLVAGHLPFANWFKYPAILGHESIGRVVAVGPKVRHLKKGDLVTRVGTTPVGGINIAWGGFAEYGVALDWRAMEADGVPKAEWTGARVNQLLPADADPAACTMFITWRETLSYLTRIGFAKGQRLLVIGSGGNGIAYVAHGANLGAAAVTMIGSPKREAACRRAGATCFVNYRDEAAKAKATVEGGYDVVIDAVGKAGLADLGLGLLKPGGILAVYGIDDVGALRLNPGVAPGTFTFWKGGYDEAETHEQVCRFYREGKLDASIWLNLDTPFSLDQIGDAIAAVRDRQVVKSLVKLKR